MEAFKDSFQKFISFSLVLIQFQKKLDWMKKNFFSFYYKKIQLFLLNISLVQKFRYPLFSVIMLPIFLSLLLPPQFPRKILTIIFERGN